MMAAFVDPSLSDLSTHSSDQSATAPLSLVIQDCSSVSSTNVYNSPFSKRRHWLREWLDAIVIRSLLIQSDLTKVSQLSLENSLSSISLPTRIACVVYYYLQTRAACSSVLTRLDKPFKVCLGAYRLLLERADTTFHTHPSPCEADDLDNLDILSNQLAPLLPSGVLRSQLLQPLDQSSDWELSASRELQLLAELYHLLHDKTVDLFYEDNQLQKPCLIQLETVASPHCRDSGTPSPPNSVSSTVTDSALLQTLVQTSAAVARTARPAHPKGRPVALLNTSAVEQLVSSTSQQEHTVMSANSESLEHTNSNPTNYDTNTAALLSNLAKTAAAAARCSSSNETADGRGGLANEEMAGYFMAKAAPQSPMAMNPSNCVSNELPFGRGKMYATFRTRPTPNISNKLPVISSPRRTNSTQRSISNDQPKPPSLRSEFEKRKLSAPVTPKKTVEKSDILATQSPNGKTTWAKNSAVTRSKSVHHGNGFATEADNHLPRSSVVALRLSLDQRRRTIQVNHQRARAASNKATVERRHAVFQRLLHKDKPNKLINYENDENLSEQSCGPISTSSDPQGFHTNEPDMPNEVDDDQVTIAPSGDDQCSDTDRISRQPSLAPSSIERTTSESEKSHESIVSQLESRSATAVAHPSLTISSPDHHAALPSNSVSPQYLETSQNSQAAPYDDIPVPTVQSEVPPQRLHHRPSLQHKTQTDDERSHSKSRSDRRQYNPYIESYDSHTFPSDSPHQPYYTQYPMASSHSPTRMHRRSHRGPQFQSLYNEPLTPISQSYIRKSHVRYPAFAVSRHDDYEYDLNEEDYEVDTYAQQEGSDESSDPDDSLFIHTSLPTRPMEFERFSDKPRRTRYQRQVYPGNRHSNTQTTMRSIQSPQFSNHMMVDTRAVDELARNVSVLQTELERLTSQQRDQINVRYSVQTPLPRDDPTPTNSSGRATWKDRIQLKDLGSDNSPESVDPNLSFKLVTTLSTDNGVEGDQLPTTNTNAFDDRKNSTEIPAAAGGDVKSTAPLTSPVARRPYPQQGPKSEPQQFFIAFDEPDPQRMQRKFDQLEARRAAEKALVTEARRAEQREENGLRKSLQINDYSSSKSNPYPVRSSMNALSISEFNLSSPPSTPRRATSTVGLAKEPNKRTNHRPQPSDNVSSATQRTPHKFKLSVRGSGDGGEEAIDKGDKEDAKSIIRRTSNVKLPSGLSLSSLHRLGASDSAGLSVAPSTQPKLFVKPKAKSNRMVIVNAISHACLAGSVNEPMKQATLKELAATEGTHFMILFRDSRCQYRAVYSFDSDLEELRLICGTGPRRITHEMANRFYKYNSGGKHFKEITSTNHLSPVVDAITIHDSLWTKPSGQSAALSLLSGRY